MQKLNKKIEELLNKVEELGWTYIRGNEPEGTYGGWKQEERNYIEIRQYSPKGEDFTATIDFDANNQVESFMTDLKDYFETFDIDEHVEMWIPSRGEGGCPESISDLVEDAESIKGMLMTLFIELEKLV